jgi:hypothetical protein
LGEDVELGWVVGAVLEFGGVGLEEGVEEELAFMEEGGLG